MVECCSKEQPDEVFFTSPEIQHVQNINRVYVLFQHYFQYILYVLCVYLDYFEEKTQITKKLYPKPGYSCCNVKWRGECCVFLPDPPSTLQLDAHRRQHSATWKMSYSHFVRPLLDSHLRGNKVSFARLFCALLDFLKKNIVVSGFFSRTRQILLNFDCTKAPKGHGYFRKSHK